MSRRASRVCPTVGCSAIIRGKARYCPDCDAVKRTASEKKRKPRVMDVSPKEWERIRADHLMMEPNCRDCGRLAVHVDHIVPLSQGGNSDHTNLASRCISCHSKKTAKFDGGFGNPIVPQSDQGGKGV